MNDKISKEDYDVAKDQVIKDEISSQAAEQVKNEVSIKKDLEQLKKIDLCTYSNAKEAQNILEDIEKNYVSELSFLKKTEDDFEIRQITKYLKRKSSRNFVEIARLVKERVSIYGIYDAVNKQQQTQIKLNCLK